MILLTYIMNLFLKLSSHIDTKKEKVKEKKKNFTCGENS